MRSAEREIKSPQKVAKSFCVFSAFFAAIHSPLAFRTRHETNKQTKRKPNMETPIIDEFRQGLTQIRTGVESTQNEITDLSAALKDVQRDNDEIRKQLDKLRKTQLAGGGRPILRAGQVVSEPCARHLASIFI